MNKNTQPPKDGIKNSMNSAKQAKYKDYNYNTIKIVFKNC